LNIFLTSAGFDNKEILRLFVKAAKIEAKSSKILFVPTAAITTGGIEMLPFCRQEILEAGVMETNIKEVQISEMIAINNINDYCAIYVAGGDTKYLVDEMNKHNFRNILDGYLSNGGIYMGVSAGSIALSNTFPGCLNYINCKLNVHRKQGAQPGTIDRKAFSEIDLTDNQAIIIHDQTTEIIGSEDI
jgi:peptidase E